MKRTEKLDQRFRYLEALYKMVGGSPLQTAHHKTIAHLAGLSSQSAEDAFYFLRSKGLLQARHIAGSIIITQKGVQEYEVCISNANEQMLIYRRSQAFNSIVHSSSAVDEAVILFGGPALPFCLVKETATEYSCPSEHEKSNETLGREYNTFRIMKNDTGEAGVHRGKSNRNVIRTVMQCLKGALTNSLFETGVRFLLSKMKGMRW